MKNINTKSSTLKRTIIISLVIISLIALATGIAYKKNLWPFNQNNSQSTPNQTSPEQRKADNDTKQQLIENTNNTNQGTPPSSASNIELTTNTDTEGTVTVLTKLFGYSDGTCTLNVQNGTAKISQSADIIYQQEYSTCAGFSVNTSALGSGTWTLDLVVTSKGVSATKQLTVSVK